MGVRRGDRTAQGITTAVLSLDTFRSRSRALRRRRDGFSAELATTLLDEARTLVRTSPREALERGRLAAIVAQGIGDASLVCDAARIAAKASLVTGDFRAALRHLDGLRGADATTTAELNVLRVQAFVHLERYDDARTTAARALAAFTETRDRSGIARTRMALADLAFREDRPRDALPHYTAVERLFGDELPERVRAGVASNRANALEACNRFRAAARHFETARTLFEGQGCDHSVAQVEYNTAYAEALRGRYEDALRRLARAEPAFAASDDTRHLAHIELDRAEIHLHMNLPEDVLRHAVLAESRFRKLGLRKECAQAAELTGRAAQLLGHHAEADKAFRRAGRTFGGLGLAERQFRCRVARAQTAELDGRPDDARRLAAEADAIATTRMNPLSLAAVQLLRARLDLADGDFDGAAHAASRVLARNRRVYAPWMRIEAHRIVARAHAQGGRHDQALAAYTLAIEELERYRGGVPPDEYMSAFLSGRTRLYEEIVELLVAMGDADSAFEFAERAKSRALVDLLAGKRDSTVPRGSAGAPDRLVYLRERLASIYGKLFRVAGETDARSARAARAVRRQASELEGEVARLLREQRLVDPESASLGTVDAPDMASVRRELDTDTAMLEFFVTKTSTFVFLVTDTETKVVSQGVGEDDLRFLIERFHYHLLKSQRAEIGAPELLLRATRANLAKLADLLLGDLREGLDATRLVIVPHGVLHHLPFHALPWDDEQWMIDRFEIVYAPSAAVYRYCGQRSEAAKGRPAVFGLPDELAPQIEDEAHGVGELLGTDQVYLREEATFERLRHAAGRARVLHVATHGMFRHNQPMLSSIRLADRWVNLYDLYDLDVRSELVVLSTCESGVADVTGGDEILGLSRGFLYAGAPALLTSQWKVDDAATREFMDGFYRHLEVTGDAATAYREAMRESRASRPHPYYWAPFFLTGRPHRSETNRRTPQGSRRQSGTSAHEPLQVVAASGRSER